MDIQGEVMMNLRDAIIEVKALKAMWKEERFDEYFLLGRAFLQEWREPIRNAARHPEAFLRTLRCLEALLVIHNNIGTADEDVREADEELFLETASRCRPSTADEQLTHDFVVHTHTSNIAKRRAFAALRRGHLHKASSLFEEATASAERASSLAESEQRSLAESEQRLQGATKHLQYLRFHRAVTAMRWAESQGLPDDAEAWWREVKTAADHSESPSERFVGRGYLLGREDLNAYIHLIAALRAFLKSGFAGAAEEYEVWLSAVPEYRLHWRFQNVVTRKRLPVLSIADRTRVAIEHKGLTEGIIDTSVYPFRHNQFYS